jgi:hypothetical protein
MKKVKLIMARIIASVILLVLVGGIVLGGYLFIKDNIDRTKLNNERENKPFHDSWNWKTCDDECYLFVDGKEMIKKDNGEEGWMEYRFVTDTLMYVRYYEDDYDDIHDFDITLKGDYTFFSAKDFD